MIPKIIHYCWFGGNPKPKLAEKCIKSWKKYCSGYQMIEWNESNFDLQAAPLYVRQAYEAKKWAFVSDYVRLQVVYDHGGIYFDTDVELVKKPDALLAYSAYFGFEDEAHANTGLGFGAERHAPILAEMLADYQEIPFLLPDGSYDLTPCPVRNTEVLLRHGLVLNESLQILEGNVAILPKEYLCPLDYYTGALSKTRHTVSIHRFAASWYSQKDREAYQKKLLARKREIRRERIKNGPKRILRKFIGTQRYERIKSRIRS